MVIDGSLSWRWKVEVGGGPSDDASETTMERWGGTGEVKSWKLVGGRGSRRSFSGWYSSLVVALVYVGRRIGGLSVGYGVEGSVA